MHKMKQTIGCLLCVFLLVGCVSKDKKLQVTMILKSTTSQFFKSMQAGANAASKEYNIDLIIKAPINEEDYQTQIDMMSSAMNDGSDVIVLSSIDYNALVEPVEQARSQKIPVIIVDSDIHLEKVDARITTNNLEAGKMAAQTVLDLQDGPIHVGIVNFAANTANGQERELGFRQLLEGTNRVQNIHSVNVQSNIESATQNTLQLLKDYPDINVITTFNEWTTLGVGEAIKRAGLMDQVSIVAFDNHPVSVEMLETGEIDALIVQNPFVIGYLGIHYAYNIANGKKIPEQYTYTKTVVITKENMFDIENQKIVFPFD